MALQKGYGSIDNPSTWLCHWLVVVPSILQTGAVARAQAFEKAHALINDNVMESIRKVHSKDGDPYSQVC